MHPPAGDIVPRLVTERLVLRGATAADFESFARWQADPVAMERIGDARSQRDAWRIFLSAVGNWIVTGTGWWMLEKRASGEVVGTVGAFVRETVVGAGGDADVELGWNVYPPFRRKGYATEAGREALAFARTLGDLRRIVAYVDFGNDESIGVARAIGLEADGEGELYGQRVLRFAVASRRGASTR